jgi:hypothetical protein
MRVTNRFMITVVRKKDPIASVLGCGGIRRIGLVPAGATEVQSANDSRYHFGAPRFSRRYRRGSATLVDSAIRSARGSPSLIKLPAFSTTLPTW